MKTLTRMLVVTSGVALLAGCSLGDAQTTLNEPPRAPQKETPEEVVQVTPPAPTVEEPVVEPGRCDFGKTYAGIGGRTLSAGRVDEDQNVDRARLKPYGALAAEYTRVLGKSPALLGQMSAVFSQAPARWDVEPQASAVSLYTAYRVGFVGCLDFTATGTTWAAHPDFGSAETQCRELGTKFWSRAPDPDELDACVSVAMEGTLKETNPRRRWAYVCASLLSTAGFLSY